MLTIVAVGAFWVGRFIDPIVALTVVLSNDHTISWAATTKDMPNARPIIGTWHVEENRLLIVWDRGKVPVTALVEHLADRTLILHMPDGPVTLHRRQTDGHPII